MELKTLENIFFVIGVLFLNPFLEKNYETLEGMIGFWIGLLSILGSFVISIYLYKKSNKTFKEYWFAFPKF